MAIKVITTLAENHYFYGVAALLNSIIRNGTYVDLIIVGYRGELPSWLPATTSADGKVFFEMDCGLRVELVEIEGSLHMVHEKPKWFRYLTEVLAPDADEYFFFDSDITVNQRMSFFGEWVRQGVAICEDVNYDMSATHPIRLQWAQLAEKEGKAIRNILSRYYNSGFLGWTRSTRRFVVDWDECSSILSKLSGDMTKFRVYDRSYVVLTTNQDSLNVAAMTTDCPISTIGPEGMGFHYGFNLMHHPLGGAKPWKRKFLLDFFKGRPPRYADLLFWENMLDGELRPYSKCKVRYKLVVISVLKFLARFYARR